MYVYIYIYIYMCVYGVGCTMLKKHRGSPSPNMQHLARYTSFFEKIDSKMVVVPSRLNFSPCRFGTAG